MHRRRPQPRQARQVGLLSLLFLAALVSAAFGLCHQKVHHPEAAAPQVPAVHCSEAAVTARPSLLSPPALACGLAAVPLVAPMAVLSWGAPDPAPAPVLSHFLTPPRLYRVIAVYRC